MNKNALVRLVPICLLMCGCVSRFMKPYPIYYEPLGYLNDQRKSIDLVFEAKKSGRYDLLGIQRLAATSSAPQIYLHIWCEDGAILDATLICSSCSVRPVAYGQEGTIASFHIPSRGRYRLKATMVGEAGDLGKLEIGLRTWSREEPLPLQDHGCAIVREATQQPTGAVP